MSLTLHRDHTPQTQHPSCTCLGSICLKLPLLVHLLQMHLHSTHLALHLRQAGPQVRHLLLPLLARALLILPSCACKQTVV